MLAIKIIVYLLAIILLPIWLPISLLMRLWEHIDNQLGG